jgi:hypothetical protein
MVIEEFSPALTGEIIDSIAACSTASDLGGVGFNSLEDSVVLSVAFGGLTALDRFVKYTYATPPPTKRIIRIIILMTVLNMVL